MSKTGEIAEYAEKQQRMIEQWGRPVHWLTRDRRVETSRYLRLSRLLASLVAGLDDVQKSGKVLVIDIGCGDGRGSYLLWKLLGERGLDVSLIGTDVSKEGIQWAKKMTTDIGGPGLRFVNDSFESVLPEAVTTDRPVVFLMREIIEHLPDELIDSILSRLRASVTDPVVLATTPSINSPVGPAHLRHYTQESLVKTFTRNNFSVAALMGFGFRPALLHSLLERLKTSLNKVPVLWRLLDPTWRPVPPRLAITLVCLSTPAGAGNSMSP